MADKKRRSPWMFVGLGCGTLTVLMIVLSVVALKGLVNNMQQELNKPFDKKAAVAAMGGLPEYPGATLDEKQSKAQRTTAALLKRILGAKEVSVLAYQTDDNEAKVMDWYTQKLEKAGYSEGSNVDLSKFGSGVRQGQFAKGDEMVMVQPQVIREGDPTSIVIFRCSGVKLPDSQKKSE
jgi:hypothetical protein